VCESHHANDLDDFAKYPLSRPYGDSRDETVNVQYAALILRTADLLHITRERTPSVMFRLINPRDPVSQREWAKHQAVRTVRSQRGPNREGIPSEDAPRDTIEVHATFKDEAGFFGLTSYLQYATSQIRQSNSWATKAQNLQGSLYHFPWRHIDQTYVTADGCVTEEFQFKLDQDRILDLLTGHTIYNDPNVVIRE